MISIPLAFISFPRFSPNIKIDVKLGGLLISGPRMSPMWTARGEIIFVQKLLEVIAFRKKMGCNVLETTTDSPKVWYRGFKITTLI